MGIGRSGIKAVGYGFLAHGGPAWIGRAIRRSEAVVLSYHNVVPEGAPSAGERALHLRQRSFGRHLDQLRRTHEIVPLAELLGGTAQGPRRSARPRAAITFDDAYRGAVTAGAAELARRDLPATFFVAPYFLGGRSFWWDAFAEPGTGELPPGFRARALWQLAGRDAGVREWAAGHGIAEHAVPDDCRAASIDELQSAARGPGISIASHSWSHPNLAALDRLSLDSEVRRPLAWLRATFRDVLPAITYPYGLSSPATEQAAENAGYRAALRVTGGWVGRGAEPFAFPRVDIPAGLSEDGFVARVAGLV